MCPGVSLYGLGSSVTEARGADSTYSDPSALLNQRFHGFCGRWGLTAGHRHAPTVPGGRWLLAKKNGGVVLSSVCRLGLVSHF